MKIPIQIQFYKRSDTKQEAGPNQSFNIFETFTTTAENIANVREGWNIYIFFSVWKTF